MSTVHTHVDYWLDTLLDHARQRGDQSEEIGRDRAAIHNAIRTYAGVSVVRAAPREPSPEALRAALDIWAPRADYDFTVVAAAIRAAYAVDGEPK